MSGKLLNAGQTCIAPDYALVPADRVDAFVAAARAAAARLYPSYAGNPDYTAIINERHFLRLTALIDDARAKGATIITLAAASEVPGSASRKLPPVLIVGVNDTMAVMREEIFGPLLPVEAYANVGDAVAKINGRPHPLAFYYFGRDRTECGSVLRQTLAAASPSTIRCGTSCTRTAIRRRGCVGTGVSRRGHVLDVLAPEARVRAAAVAAAKMLYPPYGKLFEKCWAAGPAERLSRLATRPDQTMPVPIFSPRSCTTCARPTSSGSTAPMRSGSFAL
jgi:coniferyl-aldehyde dehydrogenase